MRRFAGVKRLLGQFEPRSSNHMSHPISAVTGGERT